MMLEAFHNHFIFERRVRVLAERLDSLVPERATILDIGCGDGTLSSRLMQRRPDLAIRGVDVLVRRDTRIQVERFDGARVPFNDGAFDIALLVDVLHHTDNPIALLREAQRVARYAVVLKDHTLSGLGARATLSVMDWVGNAHHGVRLPYNYWTPLQWRESFATLSLDVTHWNAALQLYPPPLSWIFDREMHFIAVLSNHPRNTVLEDRT